MEERACENWYNILIEALRAVTGAAVVVQQHIRLHEAIVEEHGDEGIPEDTGRVFSAMAQQCTIVMGRLVASQEQLAMARDGVWGTPAPGVSRASGDPAMPGPALSSMERDLWAFIASEAGARALGGTFTAHRLSKAYPCAPTDIVGRILRRFRDLGLLRCRTRKTYLYPLRS